MAGAFDENTLLETLPYQGLMTFNRFVQSRELEDVDVAVYGIPLDAGTVNRPGARLGPRAIREHSLLAGGVDPMPPHSTPLKNTTRFIDYGDLSFKPGNIPHMIEIAYAHISRMVEADVATLGLGGDHTVAYPAIKAHAEKHGPLSLIHFDAHADDSANEEIIHGTMFWHAVENGYIDPGRSIQVGLRALFPEHDFNVVPAWEAVTMSGKEIAARIRDIVGDHLCYISLDVDGMDPAYTPGTGTPCPGGLSSAQQREILWGLKGLNAVGGDVVEVAPCYDPTGQTGITAATVALDILHVLLEARK